MKIDPKTRRAVYDTVYGKKLETYIVDDLTYRRGEKIEKFFKRLDDRGGWPTGLTHVAYMHVCISEWEQPVKFVNGPLNTEWFITFATSDDYYRYKLSPETVRQIKKDGVDEFKRKILLLS